jgi:hypothetical protein
VSRYTTPLIMDLTEPLTSRAGNSLAKEGRLGGVKRRKLVSEAMTTGSSGSTERIDIFERGSQTVAVADSQASQSERKTSKDSDQRPQNPFLPSSLCIPQSQIGLPFSYPLLVPSPGGHFMEKTTARHFYSHHHYHQSSRGAHQSRGLQRGDSPRPSFRSRGRTNSG